MPTQALIPVEEYLESSYDPDCDYIEGRLEERTGGERDHSLLQAELAAYIVARRRKWGIYAFTEQRIRVGDRRYRIPDLCVTVGAKPAEKVFTKPPFICIEILSSEDRISRVQQRIDDYLSLGAPYVWVIDPELRRAWRYTRDGHQEALDGVLRTEDPAIEIPLREIFEALD